MGSAPRPALSFKLKNILFATDFSPCSEGALPYARALARCFASTLHVVHVLPVTPVVEMPLASVPLADAERQEAELQMARLRVRHPLSELSYETLIKRGPLWHVLANVIDEKQIDLIILGTRGQRDLKKLVLGSVAEEIFRRATCPVMTIGPQISPEGMAEGHLHSILCATDFSTGAMHALPYALGLARENGARLILLYVLPTRLEFAPAQSEEIVESRRQDLLDLVPPAITHSCSTEAVVLSGSVADNILWLAGERRAQLIVMGARRAAMGLTKAHLSRATAHHVVCAAPCPVLTVRS